MPAVTDEHRAAQRERIHSATIDAIRDKGLSRLSMADIIAASGMSAGAIYSYFKGKDDLLASLAETLVGERLDNLAGAARERPVAPPQDALVRIFDGLPEHFLQGGVVLQIWAEATANPRIGDLARRKVAELYDGAAAYWAAWTEQSQGLAPEEALAQGRTIAPAIVALAQGCLVQAAVLEDFDLDGFRAAVTALVTTLSAR